MGKIPNELRETIAANIRACRWKKYPGRGGSKRCAEAFGVSPQQWSPWECGMRTPDEMRLAQLAEFFGVSVEYLRRDHSQPEVQSRASCESGSASEARNVRAASCGTHRQDDAEPHPPASGFARCPFYRPPTPGQPMSDNVGSWCWLAERFFGDIRAFGITFRLHPDDIDLIFARCRELVSPSR